MVQQKRGEIGEGAAGGAKQVGNVAEVDVGGEIGLAGEVKGGHFGVAVEGLEGLGRCGGCAVIDEQGGFEVGEGLEAGEPGIHGGAIFVGDAGIGVGE